MAELPAEHQTTFPSHSNDTIDVGVNQQRLSLPLPRTIGLQGDLETSHSQGLGQFPFSAELARATAAGGEPRRFFFLLCLSFS
jgi:hypothetical protein